MKKAIQLKVVLWIEGEDAAAHDFAGSTIEAVKQLLSKPAPDSPPLKIKVKSIEEDSSDDDDTENNTTLKST